MTFNMKRDWGTMVGVIAVAIVPLAFMDRINRFAQLPQLLVGLIGLTIGYAAWLKYGAKRSLRPLVISAFALLGIQGGALFFAHSPGLGLLPMFTELATVGLLVLVIVGFSRPDIERTITVAALVSGAVSVFGMLQYFDVGRHWVPTSGLPSATLGHRNIAAAYAVGMLPFVIRKLWHERDKLLVSAWAAIATLGVSFVMATRSRGAWVSLVAALGVAGALRLRKGERAPIERFKVGAMAAGFAAVLAISLAPAQIDKREGEAMWHEKASVGQAMASIATTGGDKGRLDLWVTSLEMIEHNPILGVGPGNWRIVYPALAEGRMIDARVVPHRAHNDFLTIASEGGFFALCAYLYLILASFRSAWTASTGRDRTLAIASVAALTACLANGMFGFPREFFAASAPLWFSIGCLAIVGETDESSPESRRWIAGIGLAVTAVAALVVVSLVRFDAAIVEGRLSAASGDWGGVLASVPPSSFDWTDETGIQLRGRAYEAIGQNEAAAAAYRQALDVHPHATGYWLGYGSAQRAMGNFDGAKTSFESGLKYDPNDGRIYNNLGTIYASSGDLTAAIDHFQRSLAADSTPQGVYGNLSAAHRRSGNLEKAISYAREGLALEPSADLANALGNAQSARGQFQEAADTYKVALGRSPDHIQLRFNLARAYERLNRQREAILTYQEVLRRLGDQFPDRRDFIDKRITQLEKGRVSGQ